MSHTNEPDTPQSCANVECPNQMHEGKFEFVNVSPDLIVGGHRSITLLLCSPCAKALETALTENVL